MQRQQQGFTLIELVIVIVILGILSAFALPRFADLSGDARTSSIQGLAGSLKSAASIARSAQLANGGALDSDVSLDGTDVAMVAGYPAANVAGIVAAAQVDTTEYERNGTGGGSEGDSITFSLQTDCSVTYTAGTSDSDGIADAYSVSVSDSGC